MRGKAHSEELRAEVTAALLAGMSLSDAARKYKLSPSVISRIRESISAQKLEKVGKENEIRIDQILAETLQAHLILQKAIVTVCTDETYIRSQSAADNAKLLEVSTDHSIRLLEAASLAQENNSDGEAV